MSLPWQNLPVHLIATSWEWSQMRSLWGVNALHSSRVFSVPWQSSWSRKIGPVPLLKPEDNTTAPVGRRRRQSSVKNLYYLTERMSALPSLWNPPSWWQATCASGLPNRVRQTVPQALLMQISTLPSLVSCTTWSLPPSNLSCPSLQFPLGVEIPVEHCHKVVTMLYKVHICTWLECILHYKKIT